PSRPPAATWPGTPGATPSANSTGTASSPPAGSTSSSSQAITVNYIVGEQGNDGFQGEVEVVNDTSRSLSGWQIVVGLPLDQVESVQNASANVTDHILFMQPESAADSIAPGTVLRVFFTAEGTETTPSGCAFNTINCS
ncbi:MAG: cellulose binding domain-containing protein, partial [Trebonia sp.]